MVDADAIVFAGKLRDRALVSTLLIAMGLASVVLFGVGLMPAYDWEKDGQLPGPGARCPERVATEQGWDALCVRELTARGPIYLGKEHLAASFVLGAVALFGAFLFDRRFLTWFAAALFLLPFFLIGAPLAFWRRGGEPIQAAYLVGLAAIVAAAALAWGWNRRAVFVLSVVYVVAWIGRMERRASTPLPWSVRNVITPICS